jgi:hypothetical protein
MNSRYPNTVGYRIIFNKHIVSLNKQNIQIRNPDKFNSSTDRSFGTIQVSSTMHTGTVQLLYTAQFKSTYLINYQKFNCNTKKGSHLRSTQFMDASVRSSTCSARSKKPHSYSTFKYNRSSVVKT